MKHYYCVMLSLIITKTFGTCNYLMYLRTHTIYLVQRLPGEEFVSVTHQAEGSYNEGAC